MDKERRQDRRYKTLFSATLLLEDGKRSKGEILNVSKKGLLILLPPKPRLESGMLVEATMHLEVADIPGATFDFTSVGKVARVEAVADRQAAAIRFHRNLNIFFDARARQALVVLGKEMTLSTEAVVTQLSGEVRKEHVPALEKSLTEIAEDTSPRIILDMTRVTFLDSYAIDLIRKLQEDFSQRGGFLKAVRPGLNQPGVIMSDDLVRLAEFCRSLYPTLYHAVMS